MIPWIELDKTWPGDDPPCKSNFAELLSCAGESSWTFTVLRPPTWALNLLNIALMALDSTVRGNSHVSSRETRCATILAVDIPPTCRKAEGNWNRAPPALALTEVHETVARFAGRLASIIRYPFGI